MPGPQLSHSPSLRLEAGPAAVQAEVHHREERSSSWVVGRTDLEGQAAGVVAVVAERTATGRGHPSKAGPVVAALRERTGQTGQERLGAEDQEECGLASAEASDQAEEEGEHMG